MTYPNSSFTCIPPHPPGVSVLSAILKKVRALGFPGAGPSPRHLKESFFGPSPKSMGPALPWFCLSLEDPHSTARHARQPLPPGQLSARGQRCRGAR